MEFCYDVAILDLVSAWSVYDYDWQPWTQLCLDGREYRKPCRWNIEAFLRVSAKQKTKSLVSRVLK